MLSVLLCLPSLLFHLTSPPLLTLSGLPFQRSGGRVRFTESNRKRAGGGGQKSAGGSRRKCRRWLGEIARLFRCSCSSRSRCACEPFASSADGSEPHCGTITGSNSSYFLSFRFLHFFFSPSPPFSSCRLRSSHVIDSSRHRRHKHARSRTHVQHSKTIHSLLEFTEN